MVTARLETDWNDYRQLIDTMKKAKAGFDALEKDSGSSSITGSSSAIGGKGGLAQSQAAQASSKVSYPMDDPEIRQEVLKLQQREKEVIAHEQAHKAVGGQYAGAASYTYTQGPDGKNYISGGEVSIDTSEEKEPEDTIPKMQQVRAAALAPAQPSPQDMSVASTASQKEAVARIEVLRQQTAQSGDEKSNGKEEQAGAAEPSAENKGAEGADAGETAAPKPSDSTLAPDASSIFSGSAKGAYARSDRPYSSVTSGMVSVFA